MEILFHSKAYFHVVHFLLNSFLPCFGSGANSWADDAAREGAYAVATSSCFPPENSSAVFTFPVLLSLSYTVMAITEQNERKENMATITLKSGTLYSGPGTDYVVAATGVNGRSAELLWREGN